MLVVRAEDSIVVCALWPEEGAGQAFFMKWIHSGEPVWREQHTGQQATDVEELLYLRYSLQDKGNGKEKCGSSSDHGAAFVFKLKFFTFWVNLNTFSHLLDILI